MARIDAFLERCRGGPALMGILNLTPDSFYDGGVHAGTEGALAHALAMESEGAHIIDAGAESTRPTATPIDAAEELRRLLPVIPLLAEKLKGPLSVDTYKAAVAEKCLAAGADLVNDVWGLQRDPQMAEVVAASGAAVVVMHNRTAIEDGIDILAEVTAFFERSLDLARRAGISRERIILDPGIGFGKNHEQGRHLLLNLEALKAFGQPLLVGLSRKSILRAIGGELAKDRLAATIGAHLAAWEGGASVFRVHDVKEHRQAFEAYEQFRETRA